jgi:carboxymethylenebutenolidase
MAVDLTSLAPNYDVTRRGFVVTSLAAGFALAVRPVSAETITTDTQGLEAGEVKVKTTDGEIPAYRARPDTGDKLPVVLVVQEIFGVHEHIKDICRRLAKAGYFAIAPELYARQGDVSGMSDIQEIIGKVVSKVPDSQVMSDLDATVAYAATDHGNTDRLAVTGFCWGALLGTQSHGESGRGLVRPLGGASRSAASETSNRSGGRAQGAGSWFVRRGRHWHSARHG